MKNSLKRIAAMLLAGIMMVSMVGCGSTPAEKNENESSQQTTAETTTTTMDNNTSETQTLVETNQDEVQRGGIVRYVLNGNVNSFFTPYNQGVMTTFAWPCYEPLAWDKADGQWHACLAKDWEVDDATNSMVIHLNEGIKFHNGDDFDAEDVAFTLDIRKEYGKDGLIGSPTVEVIDKYTVKVTWAEFSLNFETWILPQYMYSKETFEENGLDWMLNNMVGTGPYKMKEFIPDVILSFERADSYWQDKTPAPDGFEFATVTDDTGVIAAFLNGESDIVRNVNKDVMFAQFDGAGYERTIPVIADSSSNIALPITIDPNDPLSNLDVRRAIYMGIDFNSLALTLGTDGAYHTDAIGFPGMPYYTEDLEFSSYDLEGAKQLLADAGYPNGFNTTIYAASLSEPVSAYLQESLKQMGITAEIVTVDYSQITGEYLTGAAATSGIVINGYKYYMTNQMDRFNKFHSPVGTFAGATNFTEEMIAQYQKVQEAKTQEAQNAELNTFVRMYEENSLLWNLYNGSAYHYYQPWCHVSYFFDTCSAGCDPFEIWLEAH